METSACRADTDYSVGHLAGDYNGQRASFASREDDNQPLAEKSTKQGLMRRLGSLLNPKRKAKSGPKPAPFPPLTQVEARAARAPAKEELELLFARVEATLGELLLKAGASFGSSRSIIAHDHHPHHERGRSNGDADDAPEIEKMQSSRDAAGAQLQGRSSSGPGHARRSSSLSRVWQQLGGTLFCGGTKTVMEDMTSAPLPAQAESFYGNVMEEADESYWRSLAESILVDHQKLGEEQLSAQPSNDAEDGIHNKDAVTEIELTFTTTLPQPQICSAVSATEEVMSYRTWSSRSEIVPSETVSAAEDICSIRASTVREGVDHDQYSWRSLDDPLHTQFLKHVDDDGSTRLNTTLDASPVLAQNYHFLQRNNMPESSSSRNVVVDPVVQLYQAMTTAANSACGATSASNTTAGIMEESSQPLESYLWEARAAGSSSSKSSATRDGEAIMPHPQIIDEASAHNLILQQQEETTSCRVSLMTLLHEEAAGIDSPPAQVVGTEVELDMINGAGPGDVELQQRREEGGPAAAALIGEEPLALFCCVCMIRRKGAALIPCGHTFCRICSKQLFAGRGTCPLCNNLIVQVLDIF